MGINLSEKALLVSLTIKTWTPTAPEKTGAAEIASRAGADEGTVKARKSLLPDPSNPKKNAPELIAITKAMGELREYHYAQTLEWIRAGASLLPVTNYDEYRLGTNQRIRDFENAVSDFLREYPRLIQDARRALNGLFDPECYPSEGKLRQKYSAAVEYLPIPDARDIRISLRDDERAAIAQATEARMQAAAATAMSDVWQRVYDAVKRAADDLKAFDPTAKGKDRNTFRDSLIDNLIHLTDALPRLNLTDDPALEDLRREIEQTLTVYSAATLRDDCNMRSDVQAAAARLTAKIEQTGNVQRFSEDDQAKLDALIGAF